MKNFRIFNNAKSKLKILKFWKWLFSKGRTEKRFVGFGDFFVGLSVKSSKFERLSVKGKRYGVGDLAVFVRFLGEWIKTKRFFGDCQIKLVS